MVKKISKGKPNSSKAKPGTSKDESKASADPSSITTEGGFGPNARNSDVQQINRDPERSHWQPDSIDG